MTMSKKLEVKIEADTLEELHSQYERLSRESKGNPHPLTLEEFKGRVFAIGLRKFRYWIEKSPAGAIEVLKLYDIWLAGDEP